VTKSVQAKADPSFDGLIGAGRRGFAKAVGKAEESLGSACRPCSGRTRGTLPEGCIPSAGSVQEKGFAGVAETRAGQRPLRQSRCRQLPSSGYA
jgi:hypothetical protein